MPGKEPGHAIRSECLSDQPVVQTGQPRLHNVREQQSEITPRISRFRRNSEFISDDQRIGGADRDRTDDLKLAKLALSQLSYGPGTLRAQKSEVRNRKSENCVF